MKHPERVDDYLEHIAEAIDRSMSYIEHLQTPEGLQRDRKTQDAVVRNIEIIGEAVSKIQKTAPAFIEQNPHLPWAQMRAMRNIVIHQYFFVDLRIVWTTVREDLPKLRQQIEELLIEQRHCHKRD